jgi:hypothetical protein
MKLQVTFTVDVALRGDGPGETKPGGPLVQAVEAAVAEAVQNALWDAHDQGFDHGMADAISILADNPVDARLVE